MNRPVEREGAAEFGGSDPCPPVTVVICTRGRGAAVAATIESVLANGYPKLSLLIIDQSTDDETRAAVDHWGDDDSLRYVRSHTTGLSRSRNLALDLCRTELMLFTDDDCVVDHNWVQANVREMLSSRSPTLVFGDVVPATDDQPGYTPATTADRDYIVSSVRLWRAPDGVNIGIGASMGARHSHLVDLGGFDELLGAGAVLRSAEDTDVSLRSVLSGRSIARVRSARVVHYGSRSHDDFRELTRGAMLGVGASCGKLLRSNPIAMTMFIVATYWRVAIRPTFAYAARGRRPPVLGRSVYFARGIWRGLRTPVDRATNRFMVGE